MLEYVKIKVVEHIARATCKCAGSEWVEFVQLIDLGIVNDIVFSQMRQELNSVEFMLPMNSLSKSATIYWLLCHPIKNTELKVT